MKQQSDPNDIKGFDTRKITKSSKSVFVEKTLSSKSYKKTKNLTIFRCMNWAVAGFSKMLRHFGSFSHKSSGSQFPAYFGHEL